MSLFEAVNPKYAWNFDGNLNDSSVNNIQPTNSLNTSFVPGKFGQAVYLNNSTVCGSSTLKPTSNIFYTVPSVSTAGGFAISVWVKYQSIVSTGRVNQTDQNYFLSTTNNNLNLFVRGSQTFSCSIAGGILINTAFTMVVGTWYHIVLTASNPLWKLYINGNYIQGSTSAYVDISFTTIILGYLTNQVAYSSDVNIDDLRIYTSSLGDIQVQALYANGGSPGVPPSITSSNNGKLVFYLPFDGSSNVESVGGLRPVNPGQQYPGSTNITPANPTYNTVNPKVGTASMVFNNVLPSVFGNTFVQYNHTIDICISGYTIALWANVYTLPSGVSQNIMNTRGISQYQGQIRMTMYGTIPNISYWNGVSGGGATSASATFGAIAPNTWHHFAVTIKPNGDISFYLDATESTPGQNCQPLAVWMPNGGYMYALFLGGSAVNSAYQSAMNGEIDDVRVYNYALSPDQITGIYNSTFPTLSSPVTMTGTPILSQLSVAPVGAFSLRAVGGVTAKAVQVRRASDNATQDFYADRLGNLLTAPVTGTDLATWLGGATGFVATWYNQLNPLNNVSQSDAMSQPTISGGAITFTGTQWFSNTATTGGLLANGQQKYSYAACFNSSTAGTSTVCDTNAQVSTNSAAGRMILIGGQVGFNGESNDQNNMTPFINGVQKSVVMMIDNTQVNNITTVSSGVTVNKATGNPGGLNLSNYQFGIGRKMSSGTEYFIGTMKSVMVFNSALSASDAAIIDAWQGTL